MNERIEKDIRKEIESIKKLKLDVGEINNHLSVIEELCRSEKRGFDEKILQSAYEDGYMAERFEVDGHDKNFQTGLELGRKQAWDLAKKIVLCKDLGGYTYDEIYDIFDTNSISSVLTKYSAEEASRKVAEYETKLRKIVPGDEVVSCGITYLVTAVGGDRLKVFPKGRINTAPMAKEVTKTGRHFDSIDEWLEEK